MNSLRTNYEGYTLTSDMVNKYWLLGFVEGDGTFCIPNMNPTFAIKQHSKNIHFFYDIAEFLNKLPYCPEIGPKYDNLNSNPTPGIYINNKSKAGTLSVSNITQLYNYILPFFKSLKFKSRKGVDFQL